MLVLTDDIEMRIETCDFIDFRLRQAKLRRQRRQMGDRQIAATILNQVEVFDQ